MAMWVMGSVLLYTVLTMNLKGKARAVALWAYLWGMAGFGAVNTWNAYGHWTALTSSYQVAVFGPPFVRLIWFSAAETIALLALPVIWYYRDKKKTCDWSEASQTA